MSTASVAVLLVDAMRADLASNIEPLLREALPGRPVERHWALVPAPSRTVEAVTALSAGKPVPAGSVPSDLALSILFAHLGYEGAIVVRADRDHHARELAELWVSGPPISVAVATAINERLHRASVEIAGLAEEVTAGFARRVAPSLGALPQDVPLVVLADHGFRENAKWGYGPEGRYVHGGTSLEECVVPVVVFGRAEPPDSRKVR